MSALVGSSNAASYQRLSSKEGREILRRIQIAMSESEYEKVDPRLIRPMKGQPREDPKSKRIDSLAESMREAGQLMPGIIRKVKPDSTGTTFELLDGERRLHAVSQAGIPFYRAMLVKIDDNAAPYVVSVISNFNREAHTTLEILDSIIKMHEMLGLTLHEISSTLGFSYGTVVNFYSMRKLVPLVRDMLDPNLMPRKKTLPVSAAMKIAGVPFESQYPLAVRVMKGEVKLVNLRVEVVKIAKKAGIEVKEVAIEPRVLRKRLLSRFELTKSNVHNLEKLMQLPGMPHALKGFTVDQLFGLDADFDALCASLTKIREHLNKVRELKSEVPKK